MNKVVLIYNFAQHYRANIFTLMDQQMDIDFVFGEKYLNVKKMDYSSLHHKVTEVKTKTLIGPLDWQCGVVKQLFKGYDKFIMLGKPMSVSTWVVLILGRLMGKEIYFWTHGWYGREGKVKTLIKKAFFGLANGTMTYGNYARDLMIKEGLKAEKITRIGNSLAYDNQIKLRNEIHPSNIYQDHFGNNNPVLIMIGRLNLRKNLNMLLEAVAKLKLKGKNLNIILVGDGEDRDKLKQLSANLGISNQIWFYGACYDEKTNAELIYNSDMCVVPGDIGLTAIHAMMFGTPCISHDYYPTQGPEFEAIKEGITGSFFKHGDIDSLAECINVWFKKKSGDRTGVRKACYKEIDENWNPHKQVEVIKKAIGN